MTEGGSTARTTIVELPDGLRVHAVSAVDARFLHREIFHFNGYGDTPLPDHPYVIDVGANIGMFIIKAKIQRPKAEIVAFEPIPELAEAARRNIQLHSYTDVILHQVALGEIPQDQAEFTYYPLLPSSSTRYPAVQERQRATMKRTFPDRILNRIYEGRKTTVRIVRLADYLPRNRCVDLLKIDTSGSELETLNGVDPDQRSNIKNIVLDIHDQNDRVNTIRQLLTTAWNMHVTVQPAPMADNDGLNYLIHATPRQRDA